MLELDKWYVVQLEYNTIILSSYAIQSCACAKLCSGSGQSSFELIANQGITHLLIYCHHFQLKRSNISDFQEFLYNANG